MKPSLIRSAKECAYLAVFVALVIAAQLALSMVPGLEVVTVLFVGYAFVFGWKRGMVAATAFSLLRQLVFGAYATVLILYLIYFNLLAAVFGALGSKIKSPVKWLALLTLIACLCTVGFTMLDNVLTPLWYGYTARAAKTYFYASFPTMISQTVCTAVTVVGLFLPVWKVFSSVKKTLVR